ncbi:hypothetical protein Tco_0750035 [Tanacetum coccineum]|uniref:Uncharacterized protein n=1 Tax=Tanacetum coccineum TaxID=301880 RepID=A0ABQ4Z033_9ASTR
MGEPLSLDRVFDFPMDEPEPHPAYDFFTPEPLPGPLVDEITEIIVEMEEQVIALVINMEEDIAMLFDDAPTKHLRVIEDLCTHMGNLEYGHGHLVKKVIQMVHAVGRIEQVGTQVEQGQQNETQRDETMVSEMSSRESTLIQCILGMDRRLTDLERRPPGPQ